MNNYNFYNTSSDFWGGAANRYAVSAAFLMNRYNSIFSFTFYKIDCKYIFIDESYVV